MASTKQRIGSKNVDASANPYECDTFITQILCSSWVIFKRRRWEIFVILFENMQYETLKLGVYSTEDTVNSAWESNF